MKIWIPIGFALLPVTLASFAAPPAKSRLENHRPKITLSAVMPIFQRACAGCHNAQSPASGLNMTTYAALQKGGKRGPAFVAHSASASLIYRYVTGAAQPMMPVGGKLKPEEIAAIRGWIEAGAVERAAGSGPKSASTEPAAQGAVLPEVAPPVTSLAFAPDGKTLALGTYRQVQMWNIESGHRTAILTGPAENVYALAFAPNGKTLAAGSGTPTQSGETLLYDYASGRLARKLGGHADVVYGAAWTPDGRRLVTASGDKTLRMWDSGTGAMLRVMKDHADSVYGVAASPDGTRIVSTGVDRSIKVWDALTGRPMFTFTGRAHNDTAYTLAFSPDGKHLLSAGGDRVAKIWTMGTDPDTTREFRRLGNHTEAVHAAAFSPDGLFAATASADKTVNLWSGIGGGWLRTLTGANDWLYAVAFSANSQLVAAGGYDGTVLVWRAADGALLRQLSTRPGTRSSQTHLAAFSGLSGAAQSNASGNGGNAPVQNVKSALPEPALVVDGFSFAEGPAYDGKGNVYVSNCNADHVDKVSAEGRAIQFKASPDRFTFEKTNGMTFFEDGSLFACDFGRNAIIQIFMDGRMEIIADKFGSEGFKGPNDLAFDPDGNLYFTDPAGSSVEKPIGCVYRVAKGSRKVTKVAEGMAFPNGIAFSADAKTLYVAESHRFRIMKFAIGPDGSPGKPELFCQMPRDHVPDGMNFDQAGNLYVGTVGPGLVTVIDREGKITRTVKLPGTDVTNVEFGGKDLKTLYITEAQKGCLYRMQVEIGGLPLFRAPNNEVR